MTRIRRYAGRPFLALLAFALPLVAARTVQACTGIDFSVQIPKLSANTFAFSGRTMEFGPDVTSWKLVYTPVGSAYQACEVSGINTCIDGTVNRVKGSSWTVAHAYAGFTPMRPLVDPQTHKRILEYTMKDTNDGINDQGVYCGGFYHMGTEQYSPEPAGPGQTNLSAMDFPSWVLGQVGSVAELKARLSDDQHPVYVRQFYVQEDDAPVTQASKFPQLHYKVVDPTGAAVVIEFLNGKAVVTDSVGVITNNPTYDWQKTNLSNYVGLATTNYESVRFLNNVYKKLSNGTGGLGLPGDFTSPSRFVRAVYFLSATLANIDIASPEEAVLRAFRILNQFDIPEGSVVELNPNPAKKPVMEATSWTSMADLKNLRYYYHTMTSRTIRVIDLKELMSRIPGGAGARPSTIDTPDSEMIVDVSDQFKAR